MAGCGLNSGGSGRLTVTFSLEIDDIGANSVVYFNRNVRLFTARTTKLLYIAGG